MKLESRDKKSRNEKRGGRKKKKEVAGHRAAIKKCLFLAVACQEESRSCWMWWLPVVYGDRYLFFFFFLEKKTGRNLGILAEKVQNSDRNFTRGVFVSDSCPNRKVLAIMTKTKQILQLCQDGHSLDQACQRLGSGLTYRHGNQATACFLTHKAGPMFYNISF